MVKEHEQSLLQEQIEQAKEAEEREKLKEKAKRQQSLSLAKEQLEQAAAHVRRLRWCGERQEKKG